MVPREQLTVSFGPFVLAPAQRSLICDGAVVSLGSRAMDILITLVEARGEIVSNDTLLAKAWPGLTVEDSNLRFQMSSLRKALGGGRAVDRYVQNIVGRGYCFVAPLVWNEDSQNVKVSSPSHERLSGDNEQFRLPRLSTRIIGRDKDIDELASLVSEDRFVSIVGAGGIGKTTVAIASAHKLSTRFEGKVAFVDLSPLEDGKLTAATIAAALGIPPHNGDALAAVLSEISDNQILLILDNCEQISSEVVKVCEQLLDMRPKVHILATSREPLRARGDHVFLLAPLGVPDESYAISAEKALKASAVEFFMERAEAGGHREPLNDADANLVVEVCKKLDGIPLAIELVASRVGMFGLKGVVDLLDQPFKSYWSGQRLAPPRHQTLQATLDWSFNLLTEVEKRVLFRLSVFDGPFTMKAAQFVARDADTDILEVANALTSLVDKSLIWASTAESPVYFKLLETIQAYAADKFSNAKERDSILLSHAQYQAKRLEDDRVEGAIFGARDLRGYASAVASLKSALNWAYSRPEHNRLFVALAARCAPVFYSLSRFSECRNWCQKGLAKMPEEYRDTVIELLLVEGLAVTLMFTLGNSADVQGFMDRGVEVAEKLELVDHQLYLMAGQNIFLTRIGGLKEAVNYSERNAAIANAAGTPDALATDAWMTSTVAHLMGDQKRAIEFAKLGFGHVPIGSDTCVDFFGFDHRVRALIVIARAYWLTGDTEKAMKMAEEAISSANLRGRPISISIALIYSTTVALWSGDLETARSWVERLLDMTKRYALGPYLGVARGLRGQLQLAVGHYNDAIDDLTRAVAAFQREEHYVLLPAMQRSLAEAYLRIEDFTLARKIVNDAIDMVSITGGECDLPFLLLTAAEISQRAGDQKEDHVRMLERAVTLARSQSAVHLELATCIELAKNAEDETGDWISIIRDLLSRFPDGAESMWLRNARVFLANQPS